MKSWMWTPLILVLAAAGSYGFYQYTLPPPLAAGFLYGNGHVEGVETNISAEVNGRVLESHLEEGRVITQSSLLVRLDGAHQQAQLAKARAAVVVIEAERVQIEEELATWNEMLATAERDLVRYKALLKQGTVADQRVDQVATVRREALGQVRSLKASLIGVQARVEAVKRDIDLLQIQLERAKIYSPLNATVLTKNIELGELAAPGKVIAVLVDMNDLELKVYLTEGVIGRVKLNDPVRVRVSAFPDRYFNARVKRVDQRAQFTPRDINMPDERVRMVFGVVLALANEEGYLKPGMPADAWLRWDASQEWPETLVIPE